MLNTIQSKTVERDGIEYLVEQVVDEGCDPPWENSDCHGPVSDWVTRAKYPHEWELCKDRRHSRFYDSRAAIAIAKKDWFPPGAKGEELARAVRQDFEYLRGYCNDSWSYVGVIVTPLSAEGDKLRSSSSSLWGIESNSAKDYFASIEEELIDECSQYMARERFVTSDTDL